MIDWLWKFEIQRSLFRETPVKFSTLTNREVINKLWVSHPNYQRESPKKNWERMPKKARTLPRRLSLSSFSVNLYWKVPSSFCYRCFSPCKSSSRSPSTAFTYQLISWYTWNRFDSSSILRCSIQIFSWKKLFLALISKITSLEKGKRYSSRVTQNSRAWRQAASLKIWGSWSLQHSSALSLPSRQFCHGLWCHVSGKGLK